MAVFKCLSCTRIYGCDKRLPHLKQVDPKTENRYLDSSTWRCPHCNVHQDTRDIQPFLGVGGMNNLKMLTDEEIEQEANPRTIIHEFMYYHHMFPRNF